MAPVLILGCGYTGKRVARVLAGAGYHVIATNRRRIDFKNSAIEQFEFDTEQSASWETLRKRVVPETLVLHSIPPSEPNGAFRLVEAVSRAFRIVFLSTTGVYGRQTDVDAKSEPVPVTAREKLRADAESFVLQVHRSLVLRPAAIYGPFRGIHASMRRGEYKLAGDGSRYVSRIHVDDLAQHCVSGLLSGCTGAWPVADDKPCPAREIAQFCTRLLGLRFPPSTEPDNLGETRRGNRRVDGSAIRRELGIELRYPSYREGIPACIAAEAVEREL